MKLLWFALLMGGSCPLVWAQGQIRLLNRLTDVIDARVTYPDGSAVGPEFTAQLYAGPLGADSSSLAPQYPSTPFRDSPPESRGYFFGANVTLNGFAVNEQVTAVIRAYDGETWENSTWRGESNPLSLTAQSELGALPIGLMPFNVYPVPEPGSVLLFIFGVVAIAAARVRLK